MYIGFIIAYIAMILGVSWYSRKHVRGTSSYLMGNRSIPPWMSAFSYGTAYFSSVLFIGYAGKIGWNFGMSAFWIVAGNTFIGTWLAWQVLGSKTREMTQRLDAKTMPEFLGIRYESQLVKVIAALVIFIFLLPYAAGVYKGLGYLFEQVFNLPEQGILILMVVLTAFYLFVGGFMATSIADFIQGCVMIVGASLLIYFVVNHDSVGGITEFSSRLKAIPELGTALTSIVGPPGALMIGSLVVLTSLGSWGLPQMVHKFYTIRDEASIPVARRVSTAFALLMTTSAYFTGILSRLVLNNIKPESYDQIMPLLIQETLPLVVAAVILVLVLSASMSTLASIVIAAGSAVVVDLLKTIKPEVEEGKSTFILRCIFVVFIIVSYLLSRSGSSVLNLAAISWGAVSGCLLAPYLLGLYWQRANKYGALAGMATALTIEAIGVMILEGGFTSPYIPVVGAIAIVMPIGVNMIVSLATKSHEEEHLNLIYNKIVMVSEEL